MRRDLLGWLQDGSGVSTRDKMCFLDCSPSSKPLPELVVSSSGWWHFYSGRASYSLEEG